MTKFLFSTKTSYGTTNLWLLIFRVALAASMLTHGLPKFNRLLSGAFENFPGILGMGSKLSLVLAVFGEVVAPVLVILGLATRLSAIPTAITMAIVVFIVHADDPFGRKELALIYLIGFLTIAVLGGGRFSLDSLLGKRR